MHSLGSGEAPLCRMVRPGGAVVRRAGRIWGAGNQQEGAARGREGSAGHGGSIRGKEARLRPRGQVQNKDIENSSYC